MAIQLLAGKSGSVQSVEGVERTLERGTEVRYVVESMEISRNVYETT